MAFPSLLPPLLAAPRELNYLCFVENSVCRGCGPFWALALYINCIDCLLRVCVCVCELLRCLAWAPCVSACPCKPSLEK